jgi:hypothetical protein
MKAINLRLNGLNDFLEILDTVSSGSSNFAAAI